MRRIAALLFAIFAAFPAAAEDVYPSHPITLITPYPPGGATDFLARTLAEGMRTELGQTVIVQNVGGAGGTVGSLQAARAKPDDRTAGRPRRQSARWTSGGTNALVPLDRKSVV